MYETVVVSTVVMHFAFIAYVLAGGFLALRWRRTMWLHVPAVIWGIGIAAKRVDCPLTLMIQRNSLATLTLGLVRLRGEYVARWPVLMAASMLMLVPLVILYAVAQRSFVRGIAVTGLGG